MTHSSGPDEKVLLARAYLSAVVEPPAPAVIRLIEEHGAVAAADLVAEGEFPRDVAEEVEARRSHVSGARLLEHAQRCGVRLLGPEHDAWPGRHMAALARATDLGMEKLVAPVALWCRGTATEIFAEPSVALVGTRAATGYGENVAAELGYGLGTAGVGVLSGAAYGIDGAAHRGALAGGGSTVAVLACGPDRDYPAGHARLLGEIAERGLVLSEYAPGTPPRKHRFLVRNRLIAALAEGTVVVEAGLRSGAANTAATTDSLGNPVMAIPGPVSSANSAGCHELIRSNGGILVTGVNEVLEVVLGVGKAPEAGGGTPQRSTDGIDGNAKRVCDSLHFGRARHVEQLVLETGLPERTVLSCLTELEMSGLAVFGDEGWARCKQ
ncbi:DNA-processing protein DprA [Actinopolyspora saharensis]|uniref:DNA processing protein n=1 Tax=Actinopolyspora saharensis TaxID=995062 RepID=A0A1H1D234_9ACTN|nr:DNA-processing protein DprA [Actinopolyspora saharensis]SDQ70329.1 DNA processing protein [Actinopolyspora saharensis]